MLLASMAASVGHDSRQYSWLWVSHISPKNSKWLQENLSDMDTKVKAMIKLINEDADSFARRAEMYYKKRPELMKQVEEFYRAYRALAERYDQATGALRQAHRTISEVFPNQMPSMDESPSSTGQEMEPHTPEMPTFSRTPFDSGDHSTSKRNGSHPQETSALSERKSLKQFNDLSQSGENAPRAVFDGKARKGLSFESPEVKGKQDISNEMINLQQEMSRLLTESQNLKHQMLSESERANKAENEIQSLKDTVFQLNSEKGTSLPQYNQSTERLSTLESELSKAQADLKKLTDEMASEVEKLNSAESHNSVLQSELETLDNKARIQQQELEQKLKELENVHLSFQEEHEKRMQAESALLSEGKERAKSQEEVQRLTIEVKMAHEKLDELMQSNVDLESAVCELKKEVESLTEQNSSFELLIQELRDEINSLRDSKGELQSETQSLRVTISQLNAEKDGAVLQHQQAVERVDVLMQDLKRKREEVNSVRGQLQDESHRHTQTEAALLMTKSLHSKLEQEVKGLTQDLDTSRKKLNELENDKLDLENTSTELKKTILDLNSDKDAALLQQQRSLEKVSYLGLELSKAQLGLEKSEQKMQAVELEIAQKSENVNSLELSLKEEAEKRVQAETSLISMENMYAQSQEEVNRLHLEIEKLNGKLNELEKLSSELKSTILLLNTEKDATHLKNQESLMRVSDLESELSKLQAELDKVDGKVQVLEQELKHKQEEVCILQTSLEDETQKRVEGEATLLSVTSLHSESLEDVNRLAMDIEKLTGKLNEVENSKRDLENMVNKHTEDINSLHEQNLSTELIVGGLHRELDALKALNLKLEAEMGSHIGEKEALQKDFARQREEKENLDSRHHALTDEMDALKSSIAAKHNLIAELQSTNLKLKEVCAKNLIEKALLSEKVQEMEKLSEEYSLMENSISDANAEMDGLREKIKALESSESSLKAKVLSCVSEKAVLVSELENLGKRFADISKNNSTLEFSLSDTKAECEVFRTKLKDCEERLQTQLANNSALSAEKNNLFSQMENITVVMKALEGKHANLEEKHSSLSRENDLVHDQVRKLQGLLRTINAEYEDAVKSHEMHANRLEEQISSLQEKMHHMDERLEQEEQTSMSASISLMVLEDSLADMKDKNVALFKKCQKYVEENHSADILISQLEDEARHHEVERKTLLNLNGKLREGISQHMKILSINKDLGPAEDEILLQTVSDETSNILKLKEESEDVNMLSYTELSVLTTVMLQIAMESRDLYLQKCALEKEVENEAAELLSLKNKNCQLLKCNEQLSQELQKGCEREQVQKTEVLVLHAKLSCLTESYQTAQDEIIDMTEKNGSLSKEQQSLIEKYNALEDENGSVLAECMMLEHLSLFLRGHNNEVASALVSLTDEMALLSLVKGELDSEVKAMSARALMLESENNHLKKYLVYLVDVFRTRFVLLEFDLNNAKSVCQELAIELESCMVQLIQKDDELLEAEENAQLTQEKNRELCGVVGALQVGIEGAKVMKGELENKITTLTRECTTKDDEIFLLRQANETLQADAAILKEKEQSLGSAHELMLKEVEQHEREFVLLVGDAITSSVNAAVYEEKIIEFMKEAKDIEISAIAQRERIENEIFSRDGHCEALLEKATGVQEENAELIAELSKHAALIGSLSDHIYVLEEDILSLSKPHCTEVIEETKVGPSMQEDDHGPESRRFPTGTLELQQLMSRIEALRAFILNAKDRRDQESTNFAAKLAAANIENQELRARGGLEAKEIYSDNERQKDADGPKGKQVQMMKDIELDQISTCPPYGTGAALYPLGTGANAEMDDEMLQLWEAAERRCKNQTAKSSSSEHDIQAVEEVKSEYPSSELVRGRDLGINKLEMSSASMVEPHEVWGNNVVDRLSSDAQRLLSIQESIEELKRKMGGPSKGRSPMNSEYNSVSAQLHETEGFVLEQINLNRKLAKRAENYPALSDSMNAEQEGIPSRRKISEQVQKGSENVARLELELQKIQYVLLKLEEENEYRRLKVSDKRTRVLLRDYLYGRKDHRSGSQKRRAPFCGCVGSKSRTEP